MATTTFFLTSILISGASALTLQLNSAIGQCLTATTDATNRFTMTPCDDTYGNKNQIFDLWNGEVPIITLRSFESTTCGERCLEVTDTAVHSLVVQNSCSPVRVGTFWTITPSTTPPARPEFMWYKNLLSGKCLTAEQKGTVVNQLDCTAGALNQLWDSIDTDNQPALGGAPLNNLFFRNMPCLAVQGGNPGNGVNLELQPCNAGAVYQRFTAVKQLAWLFYIRGTALCMDGGKGGGGYAFQYACTPTAVNQHWMLFRYQEDFHEFFTHWMDLESGNCLTWDAAQGTATTTPCVQGTPGQEWITGFTP